MGVGTELHHKLRDGAKSPPVCNGWRHSRLMSQCIGYIHATIGTMVFLSLCSCPVTAPRWFVDVNFACSLI